MWQCLCPALNFGSRWSMVCCLPRMPSDSRRPFISCRAGRSIIWRQERLCGNLQVDHHLLLKSFSQNGIAKCRSFLIFLDFASGGVVNGPKFWLMIGCRWSTGNWFLFTRKPRHHFGQRCSKKLMQSKRQVTFWKVEKFIFLCHTSIFEMDTRLSSSIKEAFSHFLFT